MLPEQDLFFESLYHDNYEKLRLYAAKQLSDPYAVEEVLQDTFYTALSKIEEVRAHPNPPAYLMRVLKYKIRERMNAQTRYLALFLAAGSDSIPEIPAPSNAIPVSVSGIMEDARNALTQEEWLLFQRFILNGATHVKIAKELGITVWASQKRVERIREKLEAVLPDVT